MASKFVSKDETLRKFLTEESFDIEARVESVPMFYINTIKEIAMNLNAKELKDYGMAYYKYISESNIVLNNEV